MQMISFWTGLLIGTVFGSLLSVTVLLFFRGSSERMTQEEWTAMTLPPLQQQRSGSVIELRFGHCGNHNPNDPA